MPKRLNLERLHELTSASPLSQNHWAIKLGLSRGHWSDLLNGKHLYPSAGTRARLLEAFEVSEAELFIDDDSEAGAEDVLFRQAISSRFTIVEEVGQGAMGTVYVARDARLLRLVALKVVSQEAIAGVGAEQLLGEVANVSRLQHPHVLPLHDAGTKVGVPYYVMPYVRQGSLRALLEKRRRLPVAEALHILDGIAGALDHAHTQQILHCDVKPENVLLQDGHAFVMDFGIARRLHGEADEWRSARKGLDFSAGTPAYVSPEQAAGDRTLDQRSDVYSLACVAYEMLSGRTPFQGRNTQEVVSLRFREPAPPLRDFAPDLPPAVERAITRAMSVNPDRRPLSATAFVAELRHAATGASRMTSVVSIAASRLLTRARAWFGYRGPARLRLPVAGLLQDVRLAVRAVRRDWRFSMSVVLTLAFGIGIGMPALNLADHLLMRAPPGIANADRVVRLTKKIEGRSGAFYQRGQTGLDYASLGESARTIDGIAAYLSFSLSLGRGDAARDVSVVATTASYFDVLGVHPYMGRVYTEADDVRGNTSAPCVISYRFWQRDLHGARDAIGRTLQIGDNVFTITGIAPEGFNGLSIGAVDVFLPIHVAAAYQGDEETLWRVDGSAWINIIARLKEGTPVTLANEEANGIYRRPGNYRRDKERANILAWESIIPGRTLGDNRSRSLSLWLSGGAIMLFLLVVANLVNLFAARTVANARQIAVRFAVGGGRAHLLRLHLAEALVLGLMAAAAGAALAAPGIAVVRALIFPASTWSRPVTDVRSIALTVAVAVVIAMLIALWTTVQASRVDPADLLRATGSARSGSGIGTQRVRTTLLVVQAAVFAMLLSGAGAFVMSLRRAAVVDVGYDLDRLVVAEVPLYTAGYTKEQQYDFYQRAHERLRSLPGVTSASLGYMEPWRNNTMEQNVRVAGSNVQIPSFTFFDFATPDYLQTFGASMKAGRWIDESDRAVSEPVVVINETLASIGWPSGNAIGGCLQLRDTLPCHRVVGIVRDFRTTGGVEGEMTPTYYIPFSQASKYGWRPPKLFARLATESDALRESVRRAAQATSADAPAASAYYVRDNIAWLTTPLRLGAAVFTTFGALAGLIAAVGLTGVLSFLVRQQRRALAVRVALGAPHQRVVTPIVVRAVVVVGVGMAMGTAALLPLRRVLEPMLFHTRLLGAPVVAVVVLGMVLALIAAIVPARDALAIQPMRVLREE